MMFDTSYIKNLRKSYKPTNVKIMFVGLAPPTNGSFFYEPTSSLAAYTQLAFTQVLGRDFSDRENFLQFFKQSHCFLDDFSTAPINLKKMTSSEIINWEIDCNNSLSERLKNDSPLAVIVIMKKVEKYIKKAIDDSQVDINFFSSLPFPAHSNRNREAYVEELSSTLRILKGESFFDF